MVGRTNKVGESKMVNLAMKWTQSLASERQKDVVKLNKNALVFSNEIQQFEAPSPTDTQQQEYH